MKLYFLLGLTNHHYLSLSIYQSMYIYIYVGVVWVWVGVNLRVIIEDRHKS